MLRRTSEAGIDFIMRHEGYRERSYQDQAGIWTAGVGHTGSDVRPNTLYSREQILQWLRDDVEDAENVINRWVTEPLNQAQFDALVSFVFNVGPGRRGVLGIGGKGFLGSTVFKELTLGDMKAAAEALMLFNKHTDPRTKQKVANLGLTRRRQAERKLFLEGVYG